MSARFALRALAKPVQFRCAVLMGFVKVSALPIAPGIVWRSGAGASFSTSSAVIDEATFHYHADQTLQQLETAVGVLDDVVDDDSFDVSLAMGVLTVKLGSHGTFVLNKQSPNRQIWWSSPLSGPRRYSWNTATHAWENTRDGSNMLKTFKEEIYKLTKVELHLEASQ